MSTTLNMITPVASIVRPLIGLGLLATFAMVFKPLIAGLLRAAIMLIKPRVVVESDKQRVNGVKQLLNLARDVESLQPNFAAELRHLASRG